MGALEEEEAKEEGRENLPTPRDLRVRDVLLSETTTTTATATATTAEQAGPTVDTSIKSEHGCSPGASAECRNGSDETAANKSVDAVTVPENAAITGVADGQTCLNSTIGETGESTEKKDNFVQADPTKTPAKMQVKTTPSDTGISKPKVKQQTATSTSPTTPPIKVTEFVAGSLPNFWECPWCRAFPIDMRPKFSVIFTGRPIPPSTANNSAVQKHVHLCQLSGKKNRRNPPRPTFSLSEHGYHNEHLGGQSHFTFNSNYHCDKTQKKHLTTQQQHIVSSHDSLIMQSEDTVNHVTSREGHGIVKSKLSQHRADDHPLHITQNISEKQQQVATQNKISFSTPSSSIVDAQADSAFTTDYDILLISQYVACHYNPKVDKRNPRRSSYTTDSGGLQCRHCHERRIFYSQIGTLANGFSHLERHIMECKSCPEKIKLDIKRVSGSVQKLQRNELIRRAASGAIYAGGKLVSDVTRRAYATILWNRIHNNKKDIQSMVGATQPRMEQHTAHDDSSPKCVWV